MEPIARDTGVERATYRVYSTPIEHIRHEFRDIIADYDVVARVANASSAAVAWRPEGRALWQRPVVADSGVRHLADCVVADDTLAHAEAVDRG